MSKNKHGEFNQEIRNWMQKEYEGRFQGYQKNNVQQGKVFAWVCLNEIFSTIWGLDENEIENGFCDGAKDLGIDFIYKNGNDYTICQFKYKGQGSNVNLDELKGFFALHNTVINKDYVQNNGNNAVVDLLEEVNTEDTFHYQFICNCELSETQENLSDLMKKESKQWGKNISWTVYDGRTLREDYETVISATNEPSLTVSLPVQNRHLDLSSCVGDDEHDTAICVLDGNTVRDIYRRREHKQRLFSYNIRNFLGSNAVNRKIRETIENEPEFFYFYNNGISALCSEFKFTSDASMIICKDFQIINGAQTVSVIGRMPDSQAENLKKVALLMKVTSTKLKKEKGVREKIIKYNNSQSTIKLADFRSNDPIQKDIERRFDESNILWPFKSGMKKIRYCRKRSFDLKSKKDTIFVDLKELAKSLYVSRFDPCRISSTPNMLFDAESENNFYLKLFGNEGRESDCCSPKEFEKIAAEVVMWLFIKEKAEERTKKVKDKDSIDYLVLLAKWHFLWSFSQIIKNMFKEDDDRQKFYRKVVGARELDENIIKSLNQWFDRVFNSIAETLEVTKKGKEGFNFRNWMRSTDQIELIEVKIRRNIADYLNPFVK